MDSGEYNTILNDEIRALETTSSGDLWIGSRSGLYYYDFKTEKIDKLDLPINEIRTLLLDSNGLLWIGTYKNGIYTYDKNQGYLRNYIPNDNIGDSINHKEIWTIFEDSFGDIWIGTGDGVNRKKRDPVRSSHINMM